MMYRFCFTAYAQGKPSLCADETVCNLSLFEGEGRVFLYIESTCPTVCPEQYVTGDFKPFPDGQIWKQMMDVFHYSAPQSDAHWERKEKNRTPTLRLVYLKPEKVSRYIFFHYQLQEERPKPMFSKFGSIFIDGNLLALYEEMPLEAEDDLYAGELLTHNTPSDWEGTVDPCFQNWADGSGNKWKYFPLLAVERQI